MLKWFKNKKKKDNKGFTLVELIIVVAILAILVGLLAPQYVKYVEKSRRAADASNLENFVQAFKVAAADDDYELTPSTGEATYTIKIKKDGTSVTAADAPGTSGKTWAEALKEYTGYELEKSGTEALKAVKLKSSSWGDDGIKAEVKVNTTGAVTVAYTPSTVKDLTK